MIANPIPVSPQEWRILTAIQALARRGYPPSLRELAAASGYRTQSALYPPLHRLRRKGVVCWRPTSLRTLVVTPGIQVEVRHGR